MKEKFNEFLNIEDSEDLSLQEIKESVDAEINSLQTKKKMGKKKSKKVSKEKQKTRTLGNGPTIRIFKPLQYKDAEEIAKALIANQITYIYLTNLSEQIANRMIDFLTGVVYGLAGDIERLDKELFICTPSQVEITDQMRKRI